MLVMCSGMNCIMAQTNTEERKDSVEQTNTPRAERHRILPTPTHRKERTEPLLPPTEIGDSILPDIKLLFGDSTRVNGRTPKDTLSTNPQASATQNEADGKKTAKDSLMTSTPTDSTASSDKAKVNGKKDVPTSTTGSNPPTTPTDGNPPATPTDGKQANSDKSVDSKGATQTTAGNDSTAQDSLTQTKPVISEPRRLSPDEIAAWSDSIERAHKEALTAQPLDTAGINHRTDSLLSLSVQQVAARLNVQKFLPEPTRSLWLALVFPGAGQIYNHKYWKIPIFYGGFLGCTYALTWNNQMLRDYSQAYLDIMDDDPNTQSYMGMLPMGYDITGREERFKEIFKHKKNYYRKYRDMSIFAFAGVYMLSVIDAFVDAELSTFDISEDLTLHIEPASMKDAGKMSSRFGMNGVGLQCRINF